MIIRPLFKILNLALFFFVSVAYAQTGSIQIPKPTQSDFSDANRLDSRSAISASDLQRLREIAAFQKQLDKNDPKVIEKLRAEAIQASNDEIKKLKLSCDIADAQLLGKSGNKKSKDISALYEISCTNGLGYLLLTSSKEKTFVASCFEAEAIRTTDPDTAKDSPFSCQLPSQADLLASAQKIIENKGKKDCEANKAQWFGRNSAKSVEYIEVSCKNNTGYLIQSGLENNLTDVSLIDCVEAAKQGLPCKMTTTKVISLLDISAGLAKNGLKCAPEKIKVFGKEKLRKRQVVEAVCEGQAKSLIAFVPLEEGANAFETMSCDDGAKVGLKCSLAP